MPANPNGQSRLQRLLDRVNDHLHWPAAMLAVWMWFTVVLTTAFLLPNFDALLSPLGIALPITTRFMLRYGAFVALGFAAVAVSLLLAPLPRWMKSVFLVWIPLAYLSIFTLAVAMPGIR
jgi:type II secretory pathway component PulF